jgi:glycosyltransferase involved in cell wall biosynthesis
MPDRPLRIFFIASAIPREPHDTRAPNVVVNEAIKGFVALGHSVVLQLIFMEPCRALTDEEQSQLERLKKRYGVAVLPTLWSTDTPRMRKRFFNAPMRFYRAYALNGTMAQRVSETKSDVVFSLWSNPALPACAELRGVPKALYYGNLDYKSVESQILNPRLFGFRVRDYLRWAFLFYQMRQMRKYHFEFASRYELVWNVCEVDARLQRDHGIKHAKYVQNMWPVPPTKDYAAERIKREQTSPAKICASIGGLQGTANTFGLQFIGEKLAPALLAKPSTRGMQLHIYGARKPTRMVARSLQKSNVHLRGFVEDIDGEILESPVFLLTNNCGHYRAGHTRFLHAWSLNSCVIAHANNAEVMPELKNGENVLLAQDENEFVSLIERCVADPIFRARIGAAGRKTFEDLFTPSRVTALIASDLQKVRAR